jgi:UDP-glucose 4-epimerase
LRIANPYGGTFNDVFKQGFVNSVIRNVKAGNSIEIWGDGNQVRDFIYIEDLIEFVSIVVKDECISGIFNCGSGVGFTLRNVIDKIESISGSKLVVDFIDTYKERIMSNTLSVNKADEYLDWRPKHEFNKTISKLLMF